MVFNTGPYTDLPDNSILITANMQSETGFPSSHQLKSYVAYKSRLKLAARAVLSADASLLVYFCIGLLMCNCWPYRKIKTSTLDCVAYDYYLSSRVIYALHKHEIVIIAFKYHKQNVHNQSHVALTLHLSKYLSVPGFSIFLATAM